MRFARIYVLVAALAVLALPATALAQPSLDGYNPQGRQVQEEIQQDSPGGGDEGSDNPTATAAAPGDDEGGNLPFTGLDVALVLGAGLVLVGMGFGIRRMIRPTEAA